MLVALHVLMLRWTCRVVYHNDIREAFQDRGQAYAYAVLHAHQVGTMVIHDPGTGAMVSRSADGSLIVPALRLIGVVPVRGSSSRSGKDKGGRAALDRLMDHVRSGRPAYLAVDGPQGPRNRVNKGVAILSRLTGTPVIAVVAVPSRRWILHKAWDRMQIPKPFSRIDLYFSDPIEPDPEESAETYRQRIEHVLNDLERKKDPEEAPAE